MLNKNRKSIRMPSEAAYLAAIIILSLSVSMLAAADFGVSMIVAPAYLLSKKLLFLSFGQCEYIIQGLLFIVFCILMKRIKPVYFMSFASGLVYGVVLDAWRWAVPLFNEAITPAGSMDMPIRILLFVVGVPLSSVSIAVFFHTYLYPQVYDFFVKGICEKYNLDRTRFKRIYDAAFFAVSCAMSLLFFGRFVGMGVGTIVITAVNGLMIGFFDRLLKKHFEFVPLSHKFAAYFELADEPKEVQV